MLAYVIHNFYLKYDTVHWPETRSDSRSYIYINLDEEKSLNLCYS